MDCPSLLSQLEAFVVSGEREKGGREREWDWLHFGIGDTHGGAWSPVSTTDGCHVTTPDDCYEGWEPVEAGVNLTARYGFPKKYRTSTSTAVVFPTHPSCCCCCHSLAALAAREAVCLSFAVRFYTQKAPLRA